MNGQTNPQMAENAESSASKQWQQNDLKNDLKSSCLLLTLNDINMLVPRMLVAEVIKCSFVDFIQDEDSGVSSFDWRGCQVPLVKSDLLGSFVEKIIDDEARVIIFYGLKDSRQLPFYAILVNKSPQLLQVSAEDLKEMPGVELAPGELMKLVVNGAEAFIPRVDYFEKATIENLQLQEQ